MVYLVLGVLAFMAATGNGGETASKQSVIERIARAPFGEFMLIVIVVGLFAYAAWRLIAAAKDTDHKGSDAQGFGKRAAYVASGIDVHGTSIYRPADSPWQLRRRVVIRPRSGRRGCSNFPWASCWWPCLV